MMQNNSFVTTQHGNVPFRISWNLSIGEKLVANRVFDNPMEKHAVKVVLGNEWSAICLMSSSK